MYHNNNLNIIKICMGGVDRFDQYLSYYCTDRRSSKRYYRICVSILDMMLINSYILYKESSIAKKMSYLPLLMYKKTVIRSML